MNCFVGRVGRRGGGGARREEGGGGIRTEIIFLKTLTRPLYEYHIFFTDREITYARETTLLIGRWSEYNRISGGRGVICIGVSRRLLHKVNYYFGFELCVDCCQN